MTLEEKRMLQVMRVQIALTRLGLYAGRMHGILDTDTKEALMLFQRIKGLPESGTMSTETLNALGVVAVR